MELIINNFCDIYAKIYLYRFEKSRKLIAAEN